MILKKILVLSFIFISTLLTSQSSFKNYNLTDWKSHFNKSKCEIDICGLWEMEIKREVFDHGTQVESKTELKNVAIVWNNDKFDFYEIEKDYSKFIFKLTGVEQGGYIMVFTDALQRGMDSGTLQISNKGYLTVTGNKVFGRIITDMEELSGVEIDGAQTFSGTKQNYNFGMSKVLKGQGSGVILNSDGYILTNYHVLDRNIMDIKVKLDGDNKYMDAELVAQDLKEDLAILKIKDISTITQIKSLKIGTGMSLGTKLYVLGYPNESSLGSSLKLTDGLISSENGYLNDPHKFQTNAAINSGNSGGPIFNSNSELIGLAVSKVEGAENIAYGIKSNILLQFLKKNNISVTTSKSVTPFLEHLRSIRNNTVLIKCYNIR